MLLEAAAQVTKRLPDSNAIFQSIAYLSPLSVLSQVECMPLAKLPMQHRIKGDVLSTIDEQYRKIKFSDWAKEMKEGIPQDSSKCWAAVFLYKNALGERPFNELASYALSCFTTPTSNAVVERIFSYVTAVKTKPRNKMSPVMLEAIVRIKTNLHFDNKCWKDFRVIPRMLELFNSSMYATEGINEDDDDDVMMQDE